MNLQDYEFSSYFSPQMAKFLMSHPLLLKTITLYYGIGSSFDSQTNSFKLGNHCRLRHDWIAHELGHVIVASNQELMIPNFGTDVADTYSFNDLMKENLVFRHEMILFKAIGSEREMEHLEGSIRNIQKQQQISLIDPTVEKLDTLLKSTTWALMTPVSPSDIENTLRELNVKLEYLKGFNPHPVHFPEMPHREKGSFMVIDEAA